MVYALALSMALLVGIVGLHMKDRGTHSIKERQYGVAIFERKNVAIETEVQPETAADDHQEEKEV